MAETKWLKDFRTTGKFITDGGQVVFPAVQVPSANANTLDDYEEGTWVPVLGDELGASGQTYTIQNGAYTKVGRLVVASFAVLLSNKGVLSGANAAITGLPFAAGAAHPQAACHIGYAQTFASNVQDIGGYIGIGAALINLTGASALGVNPKGPLAKAVIANTTYLIGSVSYFV